MPLLFPEDARKRFQHCRMTFSTKEEWDDHRWMAHGLKADDPDPV